MLAGCASTQQVGIDAYRHDFAPAGTATYALPPSGLAAAVPENWLVPALAAKGLHRAPLSDAAYLLSVAYATRPQTVGIRAECAVGLDSACTEPAVPQAWFGAKRFVHALTIQFVDRTSGAVRYQVLASQVNDNPDGAPILHALTICALMDFPLESGTRREIAHCD